MNVIVLSHLRWDFVFQRPQHLMTRCAQRNQVWFWEEPIFDAAAPHVELRAPRAGLHVLAPHLPAGLSDDKQWETQEGLLADCLVEHSVESYVLWYYTPMALQFTRTLRPKAVVYDCMDELSAFRGAPPGLRAAEAELLVRADLVFTGGRSLYRAKQNQHPSVHCFPSSIEREFFASARQLHTEPNDQAPIPHPRFGYCGVIDERMDLDLIAAVAHARPDWHIVMLGPVVKIGESDLPRLPNIHYLGGKQYQQLPAYMAGWDAGLLPFARNESTRFISPTKTPEYLAAGLPVVSTPITDVIDPYGREGLVAIAENPQEFIDKLSAALPTCHCTKRLAKVDRFLARTSWDLTWFHMSDLIEAAMRRKAASQVARTHSGLLVQPRPAVGD
jgi:glycosyltransferase involved in cell wall biosynthesis